MIRSFVIAGVTVVFLIFAANNHDAMDVGLFPLPYTLSLPKFLFAIISFAMGVVVGSFVLNIKLTRMQHKYKSEHRRVMALQNEISSMRGQDEPKRLSGKG